MEWQFEQRRVFAAHFLIVGRCCVAAVHRGFDGTFIAAVYVPRAALRPSLEPNRKRCETLTEAEAWAEETVRHWFAAAGHPLPEDQP